MTPAEIQQKIDELPAEKRAKFEALAAEENVTLEKFMIDLFAWYEEVTGPTKGKVGKKTTTADD